MCSWILVILIEKRDLLAWSVAFRAGHVVQHPPPADATGGSIISILNTKNNKQNKQKQKLKLYIQKHHGISQYKNFISKPDYQNSSSGAVATKIFPADVTTTARKYFSFALPQLFYSSKQIAYSIITSWRTILPFHITNEHIMRSSATFKKFDGASYISTCGVLRRQAEGVR